MFVDQRELLSLLKDAKDLLEFDEENCDFGPSFGIHRRHKEEWLTRVMQILKSSGSLAQR